MNPSNNETQPEKLVTKSFSVVELRKLFEHEEFRALITKLKTMEDAEEAICTGAQILQKIAENEPPPSAI